MKSMIWSVLAVAAVTSCSGGGSGGGGGSHVERLDSGGKDRVQSVTESVGTLAGLVQLEPGVQNHPPAALLFQGLSSQPNLPPEDRAQVMQQLMEQGRCSLDVVIEDSELHSGDETIPRFSVKTSGVDCPMEFEARVAGTQTDKGFTAEFSWSYRALDSSFSTVSQIESLKLSGTMSVVNIVRDQNMDMTFGAELKAQGRSTREGNFSFASRSNGSMKMSGFDGQTVSARSPGMEPQDISFSATEEHDITLPGLKAVLRSQVSFDGQNQASSFKINGETVSEEEFRAIADNIQFPGLESVEEEQDESWLQ